MKTVFFLTRFFLCLDVLGSISGLMYAAARGIAAIPGISTKIWGIFRVQEFWGYAGEKAWKISQDLKSWGILKYKLNEDIVVLYSIILLWNDI